MSQSRDEYVEKVKAQLDRWNAEIDKLEARVRAVQADHKAEMEKQIADLRARRNQAIEKMKEAQQSSDAAFDEMRDGFEKAWKEVSLSFDRAMSYFR